MEQQQLHNRSTFTPRSYFYYTFFFVVIFLSVSVSVSAQNNKINISGKVIDANRRAVGFASVVHKESGKGVAANADGYFKLELPANIKNGNLQVSSVGFHSKEISFTVAGVTTNIGEIQLTAFYGELDEVVVTGEVKPTPVDSSIYKVKLITSEKIQQSGALNLNELLMTEANIRMSTDLVLGAQIEMMGLGGQNVKIMVDGVPVIGRLDGNVDLSQVNLDNIEQVEVIEGPMSVVYGNNALAGTINLITKQNKHHTLETNAKVYTESVGRYSGNIGLSQKLGNHNLLADGGYEYFSGVDFYKTTRSMDWKPKNLYRFNLGHIWNSANWQLNTRFSFYNDRLHYKSDIVEGYKTFDTYYFTRRYDASLGLSGNLNEKNYLKVVVSYNDYDRREQEFFKDLTTLEKIFQEKEKTQDVNQKMLRAIHGVNFIPQKLSLQSGIDFNIEQMQGPRIDGGEQNIGDYAVFLNLKYSFFAAFEIQPGLRYSYNTEYDSPLVYSLNAKWKIADKMLWRGSVSKGFRAPSIKELYYIFVDSNHEIYGNTDLEAESSHNLNSTIEFTTGSEIAAWKISSSQFFNDIDNQITLIPQENSTAYSYMNIESSKSAGGDLSVDYGYKGWLKWRVGYGLTGRLKSYAEASGADKYTFTHDYFAGVKITEPSTKIKLTADYKYNGKLPYLYTDSEDNQIKEGSQEAYHILDASVSRTFLKNQLQLILGAKNLFNVTTVNRTGTGGGAHSGSTGTPVSYGRSFFINLNYKFYK